MTAKVLSITLCVLLVAVSAQNPATRGIANPSVSLAGQASIPVSVNNGPQSKRLSVSSSTVVAKKPKRTSTSKVVPATAAQATNRQAADQVMGLDASQLNQLFNMFQNMQNSNNNSNAHSTVGQIQTQGAGNRGNQRQNRPAPFLPVSNMQGSQTSALNQFQPINPTLNGNFHGHFLGNVVYPVNNHISYYQTNILSPSYNLNVENKYKILEEHNKVRKEVRTTRMNVLRWNESLAAQAYDDVKDCIYKNKHNGAVQAMIHEQKTGNSMFNEAINRWSDEKSYFDPYIPCNVKNSCRYSQLVWATSKEVGCARMKCSDMNFISCMYYPVGNTVGYSAYIEGTRCQGCPKSCNTDKLCEWPPNSQTQQQSAFAQMGPNRFGNAPMMQQPFF